MRLSRKRLIVLALGGTLLIQAVLWGSVWLSVWLGDSWGFFAGFGLLVVAALVLGMLEQDDLAPAFILSIFGALFLGPISSNLMALAWGEHAELGPEGIRGDPSARCLTVVEGTLRHELRGHASSSGGPRIPGSSATVAPLLHPHGRDGASARVWLLVKKGDLPERMPRHVHRLRNLPSHAERALASVGASSEEAVVVSPGACAEVLAPWLTVFKGVVWVYSLLWPVGLVLVSRRRLPER